MDAAGFRLHLWPAGRKSVVVVHGNAKFIPRQQSEGDVIFFTQGDVEVTGRSEKRANAKIDAKMLFKEFHQYTLVYPLPGVESTSMLETVVWQANTFDEDLSNYVNLFSRVLGTHTIPAGVPIARLVLDCAPQADLVVKGTDDLSKRAQESNGEVYFLLPCCQVANVSWPLYNFRRYMEPRFEMSHQAYGLAPIMHEKVPRFNVSCKNGTKYMPTWISCTDLILFSQEHVRVQYGENLVHVGGIKVDSCEYIAVEYPLYGTPLASSCAVRREKIKRNQELYCLKFMCYEKDGLLIKPGDPVARVWSTFRTSFASLQFNSAMYTNGVNDAIDFCYDGFRFSYYD